METTNVSVVVLGTRSDAGVSDHELNDMMIAPNATVSGNPSVIFRAIREDGSSVTIEATARIICALGAILDGKFPDLMK